MPRSPDELALAARDGDRTAFDALVRATTPECFALAFRLTGNESDAADVVQDAYLRAFRSIARFRGDASVRTWLFRIVANTAANARRSRPAPTLSIDDAIDLVDHRADRDPGAVAERHEERTIVVDALRNLPFALRAVVVLRDIYDLPHEAIASELGISRAAAKVRLHRARKLLRERLEESPGERRRQRGPATVLVEQPRRTHAVVEAIVINPSRPDPEISSVPGPCERFASVLLDAEPDAPLDHETIDHAASCLACQAALARHHRLLRILGELRSDEVSLPPSLLNGVLDAVGRAATRSVVRALSRHRVGSAVGLGVAAALVGVIVAIERVRPTHRRRFRRELDAR